jgi:hypothetical protein
MPPSGAWRCCGRLAVLRPVEERYYAGAAVLLGVAIIYIIGR